MFVPTLLHWFFIISPTPTSQHVHGSVLRPLFSPVLPSEVVLVLPWKRCTANCQRQVLPRLSDNCRMGLKARDYISKFFSHGTVTTTLFLTNGIWAEVIYISQQLPMGIISFSSISVGWWYQVARLGPCMTLNPSFKPSLYPTVDWTLKKWEISINLSQ